MKRRIYTTLILFAFLVPLVVRAVPASAGEPGNVIINEVDSDTPSYDALEFIELYDGGSGSTALDTLVLVLYNGSDDASYAAFDLDGFFTDADGYFVIGSVAGADLFVDPGTYGWLQNGADAVALYSDDAVYFPSGTSVTDINLVDALVYDTSDSDDAGLLVLLNAGQPQVNEGGSGDKDNHSNQRCPNGDGGQRNTISYEQWLPTPGVENLCEEPPPPLVSVFDIQYTTDPIGDSPYEGQKVTTQGVVTAAYHDSDGDQYAFIQDGYGPWNGLFLVRPSTDVAVGDWVMVKGTVSEYYNMTEIYQGSVTVSSNDNPLPEPVEITDLPDESIADGIAFWEPLESVLVSVENAPVVAATSGYGEFAMLTKDDAKPGSGFYPNTEQILIRSLGKDSDGKNVVDYNPERVLVDDSSLAVPINVMPGDRVRSLVGVVDYNYGNYKLQPVSFDLKNHDLPNLPASTRDGSFGDTAITTFNVENLFDLEIGEDVIGQVGYNPGDHWGDGDTSTQNNTLRRKAEVCLGDPVGTDPFDPAIEWDGFGVDNFDGLGSHTFTCGTEAGLIISEYVEGSSNNKALEIYNGTGAAVNLQASGYAIEFYFNGDTSPGTTIQLVGTLEPGEVYIVADNDADDTILAVADQTSSASFFNGNDTVILRQGGKDDAGSTPTPEELEVQLTKLALAIQIELDLPEVIVVQEVENTEILQELGDLVNEANGTNYTAVSFETSDGRGIEVGFLWDSKRVKFIDAFQMSTPGVEEWFGPDSPSPGREPIVGVFRIRGNDITIIGNHFKSKGGDDGLFTMYQPPERETEYQRKRQAQVVRDYVDTILDVDPEALVMVTGDLNDFQFGEPDEGPDHPLAILEGYGGGVELTNLINLEKDAERFTYVYDGNSQVLDHMLVSPELLDLFVGVDVLHFNASYPDYLGADASTPIRSSDHDALEGRFVFRGK